VEGSAGQSSRIISLICSCPASRTLQMSTTITYHSTSCSASRHSSYSYQERLRGADSSFITPLLIDRPQISTSYARAIRSADRHGSLFLFLRQRHVSSSPRIFCLSSSVAHITRELVEALPKKLLSRPNGRSQEPSDLKSLFHRPL
jgi:hypothetical protein